MSTSSLSLDDALYQYLLDVSLREHPVLAELREANRDHAKSFMQVSPENGQFLGMLIKLTGARRVIEVGVFTGYSTLATALALPENGTILACDINTEYTDIASHYWEKAGASHKIEMRIAPAVDTLDALIEQGQAGSFDFAFIDADKTNYETYYERCLTLLRHGGLIVVDNVLWGGQVLHAVDDKNTVAIQKFNLKLRDDERVDLSMLSLGDGMTLARKR